VPIRLYALDVFTSTGPPMSLEEPPLEALPAKIVFFKTALLPLNRPPPESGVSPVTVQLLTVSVAVRLLYSPPPCAAEVEPPAMVKPELRES